MWCSAADIHTLIRVVRVVSGDRLIIGDMFECDIAHCRSLAVLCILYIMRRNPMHPLYGALPILVCAREGYTGCFGLTLVYLYASSLQNLAVAQDFYSPFSILWNDLVDPVFDGVILAGFKSRANVSLLAQAAHSLFVFYCFLFLFFLAIRWYCGTGVCGLKGRKSLSPSLALPIFIINIIIVIIIKTSSSSLSGKKFCS